MIECSLAPLLDHDAQTLRKWIDAGPISLLESVAEAHVKDAEVRALTALLETKDFPATTPKVEVALAEANDFRTFLVILNKLKTQPDLWQQARVK